MLQRPSARVLVSIAVAALVLACRREESASLLDSRIRCADVGRKWFERVEKTQRPYGELLTNPQFAFDPLRQTCLCHYHMAYHDLTTDAVTDVLTDKDLLIWRSDMHGVDARNDPPERIQSVEEFSRRVAALGFQP